MGPALLPVQSWSQRPGKHNVYTAFQNHPKTMLISICVPQPTVNLTRLLFRGRVMNGPQIINPAFKGQDSSDLSDPRFAGLFCVLLKRTVGIRAQAIRQERHQTLQAHSRALVVGPCSPRAWEEKSWKESPLPVHSSLFTGKRGTGQYRINRDNCVSMVMT